MQQNQNNQNNLRSIVTDTKLREDVAFRICAKINELYKEIKRSLKQDYKEEDLYTEEDVKDWVNNDLINGKILEKEQYPNNKSLLEKKQDKQDEYQIDEEYFQIIGEDGTYYHDPNIKGNLKSARISYTFMDLDDTPEAKENNQRNYNYSRNKETAKTYLYKLKDKIDNQDLDDFTPTTLEEVEKQSDSAFEAGEIGWAMYDQVYNVNADDKELKNKYEANKSFIQSNPKTLYTDVFKHSLCLLIPFKNSEVFSLVSSVKSLALTKFITENFLDIKEIKETYDKNILDEKKAHNPYEIGFLGTDYMGLNMYFNKNKINKQMIKAGILTKGIATEYYFVDKNGKLADFETVQKNFKNGKLINGYKKVKYTPEEKKEYETRKKGIFDKAKAVEMYFLYQKLEKGEIALGQDRLVEPLREFAEKFKEFQIKDKAVTDQVQKAKNISEFMEANRELVNTYETIEKERIESLQPDVIEEKVEINRKLTTNSDANKDLNYKQLSDKALDDTKNTRQVDLTNICETYPNKDELIKIINSKQSKNKFALYKMTDLKCFFNKDATINTIGLISDINKADEKYKKRNIFARLWYSNSHNEMMKTRDNLITSLSSKGINKSVLERLGKDNTIDVVKFTRDTYKQIDAEQVKFQQQMNKFYTVKIKEPEDQLAQAKKNLEDFEAGKNKAFPMYDKYREQCFKDFVNDNKEKYGDTLNEVKAKDLKTLKDGSKINDDFREWRKANPDNDNVYLYDINRNTYEAQRSGYEAAKKEYDARLKCFNKGKDFDINEFNRKKEENDISFDERIEADFNKNNELVQGGQRIENNKEKDLNKKLGE